MTVYFSWVMANYLKSQTGKGLPDLYMYMMYLWKGIKPQVKIPICTI